MFWPWHRSERYTSMRMIDFFLPKSKSYMTLVKIRKKFDSFPSLFARISMFKRTEHLQNQCFCKVSKNMFNLVVLDAILGGFLKFRLLIVKNCILIWQVSEIKHAHAQHGRKQFYRTMSICGNDFITY